MKSRNPHDSQARSTKWAPAAVITSITSAAALTFFATMSAPWAASAAEAPVGLGTADAYSVLGGQTVTNTGPTILGGNIGVSPGTAITNFPPGVALGATNAGNAEALQAQADLGIAYDNAAGRALTQEVAGDLVGQTLPTGVYKSTDTLALSGTLTLDAAGDPNAVFIFQVASGLTTASASNVALIGGAQACNVYWQVGSSATLGTNSSFKGTVLALTSIQVTTGAVVEGRALARNGAVTLDNNVFTAPSCATALPDPVPEPSEEPTAPAPVPSEEPTAPAPVPSEEPTAPAPVPSGEPTAPAPVPSEEPSGEPTAPAPVPSEEPTAPAPVPSDEPSDEPSAPAPVPSEEPTAPAPVPSDEPTVPAPVPSDEPTVPAPVPSVPGIPTPDRSDVSTPSSGGNDKTTREDAQNTPGTNRGINVQTAAAQPAHEWGLAAVLTFSVLGAVVVAFSGVVRSGRNTK